jgi:hypothetical protein
VSDRCAKRVVMAKRVAARWVEKHSHPQYRMVVYPPMDNAINFPAVLRSARNSKTRLASAPHVADLGIQVEFDHLVLWSKDRTAMLGLDAWLRSHGCETIGVW